MKKKINRYALIAFAIPFFVCIFICAGNGVYPFGDNCILHVDLYHQYCPFFTELLNKLRHGGNLMYSWNVGLGSDFVALYAYYMASPLNWLIIFCPNSLVIEFMTLLIIVKISLASLFLYIFLKKNYKFEKEQELLAIVFSIAYAFCGFVCAYSWDIMWLDGMMLTPIVMLGLKQMVEEGKAILYYISLSLCIIANFYIAMMVCLFMVFYFILLFVETKANRLKAVGRFALYSILAGGTGAFLLIPEAKVLSYSGSSSMAFPEAMKWYFNFLDEIGRMCTTAKPYTGAEHWPNMYTGIFCLLLLLLYVFNNKISIKEKIPRLLMVILFVFSFNNSYLDFIWHGFHFPNSLPGRQVFLFSLLLITIGFKTLLEYDGIKIWHILVSLILCLGGIGTAAYFTNTDITERTSFLVAGLFLLAYALIGILYLFVGQKRKKLVYELVCLLAVFELVVNVAITGFSITSRTSYTAKRDDYKAIIELANKDSKGEFYRLEDTKRLTKNDECLYGYAGTTQFSSLMNINVSHFFQKVYMEGGKNFYCYNGSTPLTSAMLSVDYFVSNSGMLEDDFRRLIGQAGDLYLYKNIYNAPKGYMIDEKAVEDFEESDDKKLSGLNALAKSLGSEEKLLTEADFLQSVEKGSTTITVYEDGYYYAAYKKCNSDQLTVESNDGRSTKYSKTTHPYLIELGKYNAYSDIRIKNSNAEEVKFNVYKLNTDAFMNAYKNLTKQTLSVEEWEDTYIRGKINVEEEGRLVIPVANEEGWTLFVDGVKTEILNYGEAFISVHLLKGEHTIELKYRTPMFYESLAISFVCLLIFIIISLFKRRKNY